MPREEIMSEKNQKNLENLIYPVLEKVVKYSSSAVQNPISEEPIYFKPNVLCCPYCGNQDLRNQGFNQGKKTYLCKRKDCHTKFIHPKERKCPPKRRPGRTRQLKYFDPNILCCPYCGNKEVCKTGLKQSKQIYQCQRKDCLRQFVEPGARIVHKSIDGILCRFCLGNNCRKETQNYQGQQVYFCRDCQRKFTDGAKKERAPILPISEDVWDAKAMGIKVLPTSSTSKLNFTSIHQPWLKELAKRFTKFRIKSAYGTIKNYLRSFNHFSNFLAEKYPEITSIEEIDRNLVINFIVWLVSLGTLNNSGINGNIAKIKTLLEVGNINGWFRTDRYLFTEEDTLKKSKSEPKYIPPYVLKQLDEHKSKLIPPVRRMVSVLRKTGVRYSELATIPFDCLELDHNNRWWINFTRVKIVKQDRFPLVDPELLQEIREQQDFLREYFDDNKYLFTAREIGSARRGGENKFIPQHNNVMSGVSFRGYLNRLMRNCNIKDENGKLYKITAHQFRHTFGTEAINNGVSQPVVQRLLGHESPEMTSVYAHIHEETLRKELDNFYQNRTIDVTGQIIELELKNSAKDLEWFTQEIAAIALPNGYCGRPRILGDCDIAGDIGCYICPHFRTSNTFLDIHKDQKIRINKILNKAYKYNWQLSIKKNELIKRNLEVIISTLEVAHNE